MLSFFVNWLAIAIFKFTDFCLKPFASKIELKFFLNLQPDFISGFLFIFNNFFGSSMQKLARNYLYIPRNFCVGKEKQVKSKRDYSIEWVII